MKIWEESKQAWREEALKLGTEQVVLIRELVKLQKENAELRKLLREAVSHINSEAKSNDRMLAKTFKFLYHPEVKEIIEQEGE